jgi:hypothetical protein
LLFGEGAMSHKDNRLRKYGLYFATMIKPRDALGNITLENYQCSHLMILKGNVQIFSLVLQ